MKDRAIVNEVGLRDGLQNQPVTVGTEAPYVPALNVTLHLDHSDCESLSGAAQEECLKDGRLDVYGEWESFGVPRTAWSQLTADCDSCGTLAVEECRGCRSRP